MRLSKLYAFSNIAKLLDACSSQEGGGFVVTDDDHDIIEVWDDENSKLIESIADEDLLLWNTALGKLDLDTFIQIAFFKDSWSDEEYAQDQPYKHWHSVFGHAPLDDMERRLLIYFA